jgi:hypothetical protein
MDDVIGPHGLDGILLFLGLIFLSLAFILLFVIHLARRNGPTAIISALIALLNILASFMSWYVLNQPSGNVELDGIMRVNFFTHPISIWSVSIDWADSFLLPWAIMCVWLFIKHRRYYSLK